MLAAALVFVGLICVNVLVLRATRSDHDWATFSRVPLRGRQPYSALLQVCGFFVSLLSRNNTNQTLFVIGNSSVFVGLHYLSPETNGPLFDATSVSIMMAANIVLFSAILSFTLTEKRSLTDSTFRTYALIIERIDHLKIILDKTPESAIASTIRTELLLEFMDFLPGEVRFGDGHEGLRKLAQVLKDALEDESDESLDELMLCAMQIEQLFEVRGINVVRAVIIQTWVGRSLAIVCLLIVQISSFLLYSLNESENFEFGLDMVSTMAVLTLVCIFANFVSHVAQDARDGISLDDD